MEYVHLGNTDMVVSRLGTGLAEIGFLLTVERRREAETVLNLALDSGVNFLDTAACYGVSEELLGLAVSDRRDDFFLATKAGHVVGDTEGEPFSGEVITHSIERSLARMKTDYIDLVQLHSCDLGILKRGEAIHALAEARNAGKCRYIGYSGDNEAALWAAESGSFDTLQTSFNIVDQQARHHIFRAVRNNGLGLIAKRPIGNAVWGRTTDPDPYKNSYTSEYFKRALAMRKLDAEDPGPGQEDLFAEDLDRRRAVELSLGFTLSHDVIHTAILGTHNPDHMRSNLSLVEGGASMDPASLDALHRRFDRVGEDWEQRT
jgi:hypothetical protein